MTLTGDMPVVHVMGMRRMVVIFVVTVGAGGVAGYLSRSSAKVVREVEMKRSVREVRGVEIGLCEGADASCIERGMAEGAWRW